jgi:hypothetical protein
MKPIAAGLAVAAAALLIALGPVRLKEVDGGLIAQDNAYIHDLIIDGHRDKTTVRQGLPPWNQPFTGFTQGNGIVIDGRRHVTIRNVTFRNIAGFAILVARSHDITIDHVRVEAGGSLDANGRNNTTGGILFEEGTTDFRVTASEFRDIRGNGIWTHSLYTSPRNSRGLIQGNRFDTVGRDAIQVGHATEVRVVDNTGRRIGYPAGIVDAEPVGVDTAGNVDRSVYAANRFRDIRGKCIDLDGFHDGEVRGNVCADVTGYGIVMNNTNPDMQSSFIRVEGNVIDGAGFGGIFVIGHDNVVRHNRLLNLNRRPQGDPVLRSGIYLGDRAERPAPAQRNVIEDNQITGAALCVAGSTSSSQLLRNDCR